MAWTAAAREKAKLARKKAKVAREGGRYVIQSSSKSVAKVRRDTAFQLFLSERARIYTAEARARGLHGVTFAWNQKGGVFPTFLRGTEGVSIGRGAGAGAGARGTPARQLVAEELRRGRKIYKSQYKTPDFNRAGKIVAVEQALRSTGGMRTDTARAKKLRKLSLAKWVKV